MKLYQCGVSGPMARFPDRGLHIHSERVFLTRTAAEAYLPEFKRLCCTPTGAHDMTYLASITSEGVVELEVADAVIDEVVEP